MTRHRNDPPGLRSLQLAVAAVLAVLVGLAVAVTVAGQRSGPPVPPPASGSPAVAAPASTPQRETAALHVLHAWDVRRAAAYRSGSASRLRGLYVPGSSAGVRDEQLLVDYRVRGYRVVSMGTQVLGAQALGCGPRRCRIRVTDRLVGAVAVGHGRRVRLPATEPTTRVLDLRRGPSGWRVAAVRPG